MPMTKPLLVFDVNETLLDIDALAPLFDRVFAVPGRMREWFAQLILYSQAITLSGRYIPFGTLGGGVLRMLGDIHDVAVTDDDLDELKQRVATMPVHPEVPAALKRLADAGFRLVTLTNTPPDPDADALKAAGIADRFERRFTVAPVERFKPAPETYRMVTDTLGIANGDACLIAAHLWDTIGAQALGWRGALVRRGVNATIDVPDMPVPTIVGDDLTAVAAAIIDRWR